MAFPATPCMFWSKAGQGHPYGDVAFYSVNWEIFAAFFNGDSRPPTKTGS
jgi:hypothetical protein